jgi:hypothetical protein
MLAIYTEFDSIPITHLLSIPMPSSMAFSFPREVLEIIGDTKDDFWLGALNAEDSSVMLRCLDQPSAFRRAFEVTRGRETEGPDLNGCAVEFFVSMSAPNVEKDRSIEKGEFGGNAAMNGGAMQDKAFSTLSVRERGLGTRRLPEVFFGVRPLYGLGREFVRGRRMQSSSGRCV